MSVGLQQIMVPTAIKSLERQKEHSTILLLFYINKSLANEKKKHCFSGVEKEKEIKRRTSQQKGCGNLDSCDGRRNYV